MKFDREIKILLCFEDNKDNCLSHPVIFYHHPFNTYRLGELETQILTFEIPVIIETLKTYKISMALHRCTFEYKHAVRNLYVQVLEYSLIKYREKKHNQSYECKVLNVPKCTTIDVSFGRAMNNEQRRAS